MARLPQHPPQLPLLLPLHRVLRDVAEGNAGLPYDTGLARFEAIKKMT